MPSKLSRKHLPPKFLNFLISVRARPAASASGVSRTWLSMVNPPLVSIVSCPQPSLVASVRDVPHTTRDMVHPRHVISANKNVLLIAG